VAASNLASFFLPMLADVSMAFGATILRIDPRNMPSSPPVGADTPSEPSSPEEEEDEVFFLLAAGAAAGVLAGSALG